MWITRKAEFSASHVCRDPRRSEEENRVIYGLEANPHGHNYTVEVTLEGEPDPVTGMVADLRWVKEVLAREVVEPMDHRFLNGEVPPFQTLVPTVENVAIELWRRLKPHFNADGIRLLAVRLYETEDLWAEYRG